MMEKMNEEMLSLEETVPVGTILCVARDVLRRWYIIVTVALVAAMAAFVISDAVYVPRYSTTTTLVVSGGGTFTSTYQNLSATTEAATVLTEILNSSLLLQKVTEETGIIGFDGTITASVVGGTNLLNVTVQGGDARTVYLVTESLLANHGQISREVLGDTVLEVLREPVIPAAPSNVKNTSSMVRLALLMGAAATTGILAVLAWMEDKIRSRTEADKKLICRVLGELHHERKRRTFRDLLARRKPDMLITNPLTGFLYCESIHKLTGRIDKLRRKGQHVLMVTSLLENEGKSTVAVNLALSWAAKGRRVLLIDCDLRNPSCHKILNLPESSSMVQLLQGDGTLEDHVVTVPGTTLQMLSGGKGVRNASTLLSSTVIRELLHHAAVHYDLVVVDTPPMGVTPDAEAIGEFTHCAVVVTRQNAAEASLLNHAMADLKRTGTELLGCILNDVYGVETFAPAYHRGYGQYGKYGKYGKYGRYGQYGQGGYHYGYGVGYDSKKKDPDDREKGAV